MLILKAELMYILGTDQTLDSLYNLLSYCRREIERLRHEARAKVISFVKQYDPKKEREVKNIRNYKTLTVGSTSSIPRKFVLFLFIFDSKNLRFITR